MHNIKSQQMEIRGRTDALSNPIRSLFLNGRAPRQPLGNESSGMPCVIYALISQMVLLINIHDRTRIQPNIMTDDEKRCHAIDEAWNIFDFFLVVLGFMGLIMSYLALDQKSAASQTGSESRVIRIARVLRTMRFLRLFLSGPEWASLV